MHPPRPTDPPIKLPYTYTDVERWFELGGDHNDLHKTSRLIISLYFAPDLLSKLSVNPKF